MSALGDLAPDEIIDLFADGAGRWLSPTVQVFQLDHALQTAALLAHLHPGDHELAAAGLVHDIGHLLPGGTDEAHATQKRRGPSGGPWASGWRGRWGCTWRRSGISWRPKAATAGC